MGKHETETRQQILDSCVALIERAEGRRLRVKDIAEAAHVAVPTLYYYFNDRETLLAEAHAIRLLDIFSEIDGDRSRTVGAVEAVDQDGYVEAVAEVREPYWDPSKRDAVWRYIEALTEIHRDPEVFNAVARVIEGRIMQRVATVAELQRLGWVTEEVDPGQWVLFYFGAVFGQVFWDLCPSIDTTSTRNSAVDWIHSTIAAQGADMANRGSH